MRERKNLTQVSLPLLMSVVFPPFRSKPSSVNDRYQEYRPRDPKDTPTQERNPRNPYPGGDRYRPPPPYRDSHPAARTPDSYRPTYESDYWLPSDRRDSSTAMDHSPRRDNAQGSHSRNASQRYEGRRKSTTPISPTQPRSPMRSSIRSYPSPGRSRPRRSISYNEDPNLPYDDSDTSSKKVIGADSRKPKSRSASQSSIASSHVSDEPPPPPSDIKPNGVPSGPSGRSLPQIITSPKQNFESSHRPSTSVSESKPLTPPLALKESAVPLSSITSNSLFVTGSIAPALATAGAVAPSSTPTSTSALPSTSEPSTVPAIICAPSVCVNTAAAVPPSGSIQLDDSPKNQPSTCNVSPNVVEQKQILENLATVLITPSAHDSIRLPLPSLSASSSSLALTTHGEAD